MPVPVVQVWTVLVIVLDGVVAMQVRVLSRDGLLVHVIVMTVVVAMRVLVLDRLVQVAMSVALGQMQVDAGTEQSRRQARQRVRRLRADQPGQRRAHERREREDRSGAGGPDPALRQQVQPEAEPVPGGAAREQGDGGSWPGRRSWTANATPAVSAAPRDDFAITISTGSLSARGRVSTLSSAQARLAPPTASAPRALQRTVAAALMVRTTPATTISESATTTRLPIDSR